MDTLCKNRIVEEITLKVDADKSFWISKNVSVNSLIQNGPQCGIVALCMALNFLKIECTINDLMDKARHLNFTKNGEIFEVNFLYELAKLGTNAQIVDLKRDVDFFEELLKAKLILIPYDCDRNYEPCNKKGIKAHWALITGFLLPIDYEKSVAETFIDFNNRPKLSHRFEKKSTGLNFVDSIKEEQIEAMKNDFEENEEFRNLIYVICRQGKSKNLGVWSLGKLLESNRQLKEINTTKCDPDNFVLPSDGDLSKTLSGRFLVFY